MITFPNIHTKHILVINQSIHKPICYFCRFIIKNENENKNKAIKCVIIAKMWKLKWQVIIDNR